MSHNFTFLSNNSNLVFYNFDLNLLELNNFYYSHVEEIDVHKENKERVRVMISDMYPCLRLNHIWFDQTVLLLLKPVDYKYQSLQQNPVTAYPSEDSSLK